MSAFCINEYCDCLECDLYYDREEFNAILLAYEAGKLPQIKRLNELVNKRQASILKLIGDDYIEYDIPERLLDIYLKLYALGAGIDSFICRVST